MVTLFLGFFQKIAGKKARIIAFSATFTRPYLYSPL